jgi:hypothetical protein
MGLRNLLGDLQGMKGNRKKNKEYLDFQRKGKPDSMSHSLESL